MREIFIEMNSSPCSALKPNSGSYQHSIQMNGEVVNDTQEYVVYILKDGNVDDTISGNSAYECKIAVGNPDTPMAEATLVANDVDHYFSGSLNLGDQRLVDYIGTSDHKSLLFECQLSSSNYINTTLQSGMVVYNDVIS